MLERLVNNLKLLNTAEKERREARFLADRFDAIKSNLKEFDVKISNFGNRDFDDRFVTTVKLSFDKRHEQEVRDELANAEIKEITDPWGQIGTWIGLGMTLQSGFDKKFLKKIADERHITIYKGKNILNGDMKRLCTLESEQTK